MDLNVKIIQSSFEQLQPRAEELANQFYRNLFQDYPAIKTLFASAHWEKQKRLLVATLAQVVYNLENTAYVGEYLGKLGEHYAAFGVRDEHVEWVQLSLLKTLEAMFGPRWTAEEKRQWKLTLNVISALTREGLSRQPWCKVS